MSFTLITELESCEALDEALASTRTFALDCEAAGFHRYSDRLCLVQITVGTRTFVLDTLAFDARDVLEHALARPDVQVIMHGAAYDLRLLRRDLGIRVRSLFDTQIAAALLGEGELGLSSLLESRLGVTVSKKYQRADWAQRPLSDEMLEYAAADTRYLATLAEELERELVAKGRLGWAEEECSIATAAEFEEVDEDPVLRVKGAHSLAPREVTALRAALVWRDGVARDKDRAPFRIAGDRTLMAAVLSRPQSVESLGELKGFNPRLARVEGKALLRRLREVEGLPEAKLVPYPRNRTNGRGRPPREVEERVERLKAKRNRRAEALSIQRGTLLPNSVLLEIALAEPTTLGELERVPGIRKWQVTVLGESLLEGVA